MDITYILEIAANGLATALWFVVLSKFNLLPVFYVKFPQEDE